MSLLLLDDYIPAGLVARLARPVGIEERQANENTERVRVDLVENETLAELRGVLFSQDLVERVEPFDDLAWRSYWSGTLGTWQAFVSEYDPRGRGYTWHVDQGIQRRALNWIINLNQAEAGETGGALEISTQPFSFQRDDRPSLRPTVSLEARTGRLVIFPACWPHRVTSPTWKRTTCHGHFML